MAPNNSDILYTSNSAKLSLKTQKESLQDLVNRYRELQNPRYVQTQMIKFTLKQDLKLYNSLKGKLNSKTGTPMDTGLLESSWVKPVSISGSISGGSMHFAPGTPLYLTPFKSGNYSIYVLNTATVGQQQKLKYAKEGWGHFKKKKVRGSYKLKRYLRYVNSNPGKNKEFYTKQLRNIRQHLNSEWKNFVKDELLPGARYRISY